MKTDHDVLVEVNVKLERVISDIADLKDNTANRVDTLEKEKIDIDEYNRRIKQTDGLHEDHEIRLRRIEKWGLMALGALAIIQFLLAYIK